MERYRKLTLLHSNDMHGDFLAEKVDENLVGGVSMLSGYIKKVREEEPNTLYCIAGDMFRGSVIDSEYQGLSTVEIMNMLNPDVVTIGNHELDYGLAHLLFIEKCANFPIINSNLYISINGKRLFKPYEIVKVNGMKVLFIGILTQEIIAQTKSQGVIGTFIDIQDAAKEVGKICDAFNSIDIDFTVLLTHIGFEEDKKLAALLDPNWGVDVIIGGHSHTFMDKPEVVNGIPIVQAGTGTDQIGRFDILVDTDNNCIESYNWSTIPIDELTCPRDEEIEKFVENIKEKTSVKYSRPICKLPRRLKHPSRLIQTEMGSYFCDVLKRTYGVDIFLMSSGFVRKNEAGPNLNLGDVAELLPFTENSVCMTLEGKQLKKLFKRIFRTEARQNGDCEYYQLSEGLEIVYDDSSEEIIKLELNGKPIYDDEIYRVGTTQYHINNCNQNFDLKSEELSKIAPTKTIATNTHDVFVETLSNNSFDLDNNWTKRITIINNKLV